MSKPNRPVLHLANGEAAQAAAIRVFYDEYCAVMDLPAEFYLETVRTVFQEHALPLGKFEWRGRRVDPAAIKRTALFTVEGERDDICAVARRSLPRNCAVASGLHEASPCPDRRRPLRCVQRTPLEQYIYRFCGTPFTPAIERGLAQRLAGACVAVAAGAVISVVAKSPGMMISMNSMSSDQS